MHRLRHVLERADRLLAELAPRTVAAESAVSGWTVSRATPDRIVDRSIAGRLEAAALGPADPASVSPDGATLHFGPAPARLAWLGIDLPSGPSDRLLHARFGAEALVFVDGRAVSGIDPHHDEIALPETACAVDVLLFTGREERPLAFSASIVRPDPGFRAFRNAFRAVAGAARTQSPESVAAAAYTDLLEAVLAAVARPSGDLSTALDTLRDGLAALRDRLDDHGVDVHLVASSHIDVTWLWTLDETRFKMAKTTATALHLMDRFPGYGFSQSQPALYALLEEDAPELFGRMAARVGTDWEPLGACWIEPDCSVPSGESLVRQILFGQRYWMDRFGIRSRVLWLPDTFGYAASMPQILRRAGLDTFVTTKMTWNDTNRFPHDHFDWEGIDGTRIRCVFPQYLGGRVLPEDIDRYLRRSPSLDVVPALLYSFGWGDGGGGPVPEDVEVGAHLADLPAFPACRPSDVETAVRRMADAADRRASDTGRAVPVWTGELYLELHRGTYTTHGRAKWYNRRLEAALREAEIWSAIAGVRAGSAWPSDALRGAWETLLLHQFHDIVTGTSIAEVYDSVYPRYAEALDAAERLVATALERLVTPDDAQLAVTNAHGWSALSWAEATVRHEGPFHLVAPDGSTVPHQLLETDGNTVRIGFEIEVPGLGIAPLRVAAGEAPVPGDGPRVTEDGMENGFFGLRFDDAGRVASLRDLRQDREWLDGPALALQTFDDRPTQWEAWDIDRDFARHPLDLLRLVDRTVVESGPLRATTRLVFETPAGSRVTQDVQLYRTIRRIDVAVDVDWKDPRVLLKAAFPLDVRTDHATFEIPFGSVHRPTHRNTSWDAARFEVSGQRWVDLSDATGGMSLLNDCRYGYDVEGGLLRLTLLRNPAHADARQPTPPFAHADHAERDRFTDTGRHRIRYALLPHAGDDRSATVVQAAVFNAPFRVLRGRPVTTEGAGCDTPGVCLDTLKAAEDGHGWILRIWETLGGRRTARVRLPFPVREARSVDLLEEDDDGTAALADDRTLDLVMGPFEIRSFRLLS